MDTQKEPMERNSHHYHHEPSVRDDAIIALVAAIIIYVVARSLNLFERLHDILNELEYFQLDEVFVTIIGLSIVLTILSIRRWRFFRDQIASNQNVERGLAQERILLRTVIDHLPDYIFAKDRDGRFILSNSAHAAAVHSTPEKLIGKRAYDAFPYELAAQYRMDDEIVLRSGKSLVNIERTSIDANGNARHVLTTKVPIQDSEGDVTALVGISRDITHRKREEQQALELAQERERIKMMTVFTRDAAHDFRTPLATISTSLYLLQRDPDPNGKQRHAANIEQAVARLSQLLNGLTTMTRLESLNDPNMQPLNVNELLQSVISTASSLARHPNIHLKVDLDGDIPLICGSEDELHLAFLNLVDNAVQFTPDGGLIIIHTAKKEHHLVVEVQDTGMGISTDDLKHIFDRFYRTDRARSSDTGGIGLGLSITKKIIELHSGLIEAESTIGAGTTVRVVLPSAQSYLQKTVPHNPIKQNKPFVSPS